MSYCETDTLQCCTEQSLVEERRSLGEGLLNNLVDEIDKNRNRLDYIDNDFRDCMLINNMFIIVGDSEWMDFLLLKVNNELLSDKYRSSMGQSECWTWPSERDSLCTS